MYNPPRTVSEVAHNLLELALDLRNTKRPVSPVFMVKLAGELDKQSDALKLLSRQSYKEVTRSRNLLIPSLPEGCTCWVTEDGHRMYNATCKVHITPPVICPTVT